MSQENIANSAKPNPGRMYDYLLGGHHNFEVDRVAAEQLKALAPFAAKAPKLQRWCLQDLAVELTEKRGYDIIIDFASGLPTQDHIHEAVPDGTTVIYSDYDPVTVEYACEILQGTPNVYFFQGDARHPEALLNRPEVQDILKDRRDVALVYWGVTAFFTDAELVSVAQYLHQWADPKSCWAFNAQLADVGLTDPGVVRATKLYEQMGSPLRLRTLEEYQTLTQPWRPDEKGFIPFMDWHGIDRSEMGEEDLRAFGVAGGGYGAYLTK
jgi:hypothetical protein